MYYLVPVTFLQVGELQSQDAGKSVSNHSARGWLFHRTSDQEFYVFCISEMKLRIQLGYI